MATTDERGQAVDDDPDALLGVEAVFGIDLPRASVFRDEVGAAFATLMRDGARKTVLRYASSA